MAEDVKPEVTAAQSSTTAATSAAVSASGDEKSPSSPAAGGADATTAKATAADPGTLLTSDPEAAAGEVKNAVITWPEDWREQLSGDNKERMRWLARYSSIQNVINAHEALRAKMSAGELKAITQFPAEGDDKAKADWRKANGVPDKPEGYEPKVDGLVFGESDKPMLQSFQQHAFGKNWTPAQFNEALEWYAAEQEQIATRQAEADEQFREESRNALYSEWGAQDFRRNINAVQNLLSGAPEGLKDRILGARLADGRLLGDDVGALRWLADLAREQNPAATLVPAGADAGKSVNDELASIRKFRSENPDKYDADKTMQARELQLLEAQSKMKSRAA